MFLQNLFSFKCAIIVAVVRLRGMQEITLKPIGIVKNGVKQAPGAGYEWNKIVSEIAVDDSLTEALEGLEEFSHIIILYWMHKSVTGDKAPMKVHPHRNRALPEVGVFSSRSPQRPNAIGKTVVRLLKRAGNILVVRGLDAIDGTPVVDIKPYIPGYDSVRGAKGPGWAKHR